MAAIELYSSDNHHNILLSDYTRKGLAVQANHHLILHGNSVLLIDPGGHKVFNKLVEAVERLQSDVKIESIVFSHQDPDIVAALNGWLMITDARAYISALWERFVPHFGIDPFLEERLLPVQDGGCWIDLDGAEIALLPAHFLHSAGNFHVYDPQSKVLYSGDLGASFGPSYRQVTDFDGHIDFMAPFHRRYMGNNLSLKRWLKMVRQLDLEVVAPQHGALFKGKAMIKRFFDWLEDLSCGTDILEDSYKVPEPGTRPAMS